MSSTGPLLSENQSAELAGVSIDVIRQYKQFGLLNPIDGAGQEIMYAEKEIRTLFNVDAAKASQTAKQAAEELTANDSQASEKSLREEIVVEVEPVKEYAFSSNPEFSSNNPLTEINKSLREQIEMLKEERDWLRKRLEDLESRFEREQTLVLSESETIRRLLHQQANKRSIFAGFLPWLKSE